MEDGGETAQQGGGNEQLSAHRGRPEDGRQARLARWPFEKGTVKLLRRTTRGLRKTELAWIALRVAL